MLEQFALHFVFSFLLSCIMYNCTSTCLCLHIRRIAQYLVLYILNSRSDLVFMTFWPNLHLSVSQVGMYVFGNSILRQKAKMFLKFELQRALSKSPIGMRCCCTEVLQCAAHVQTIMDYILHFILWNFLEEILTFVVMMMAHMIHPLLKESFARVF